MSHIHGFQTFLSQSLTNDRLPLKASSINTTIKAVRVFLELLPNTATFTGRWRNTSNTSRPRSCFRQCPHHGQVRLLMRKINTSTPTGIRDRTAIELLYSIRDPDGELELSDP